MLGITGTNPPCQRAHAALCAGMTIGTGNGKAGQRNAQLGRNHMHNALIGIGYIEQTNTGSNRCGACFKNEIFATGHQCVFAATEQGVDNMINGAEHLCGVAHRTAAFTQAFQGNGAHAFVQKNPVHGQQR